jgi:hypothetical protein
MYININIHMQKTQDLRTITLRPTQSSAQKSIEERYNLLKKYCSDTLHP